MYFKLGEGVNSTLYFNNITINFVPPFRLSLIEKTKNYKTIWSNI